MIKILYVCGGAFDFGGISSFIINYYRHFSFKNFSIDFLIHGDKKGIYDDEVTKNGSRIFRFPIRSKHPFLHKKMLIALFKREEYDIVHSHLDAGNYPILKVAKKCGIKIRISHSHNTDFLCNNSFKLVINKIYKRKITSVSTHNIACSSEAGKWLFGRAPFLLFKNAIDINNFLFDEEKRCSIRNELGLSNDNVVIGHVGRFDYQKNHQFLLDVFKKVYDINSKYKLVLIGDGHLRKSITEKIDSLGLNDSVFLLGQKQNIQSYYNAFDLFTLPSNFEGLGIVAIEAQTNGLPCVLSDKVPTEASINSSTIFLPLDVETWANTILKTSTKRIGSCRELASKHGYDIEKEACLMEKFYLEVCQK